MSESELERIIKIVNSGKALLTNELTGTGKLNYDELERELMYIHRPERALIVYGTLAPNKPNHFVVEHIKGTWHKGKVKGKLINKGWGAQTGHGGYTPASPEDQSDIEASILLSGELINHWQRLDDFEGDDYKRVLATYELETGEKGVGYIYAVR